jgi:hypothetical protein
MRLFTSINPETGAEIRWEYPQTRELAIQHGLAKYWPGTRCEIHNTQAYVFVKSGRYNCCVNEAGCEEYTAAVVHRGEPCSAEEAQLRGIDFYWSPQAFIKCGHPGKTTLRGTCYECAHARANSPRQLALKAGEAWYTPAADDPCPNGHVAPRRVINGSCQACERDARPAGPEPFYRQHPEMVLSFEAAKSMGLNVYRTGEPCKYGHRGWRYVSTRGCLVCAGRD